MTVQGTTRIEAEPSTSENSRLLTQRAGEGSGDLVSGQRLKSIITPIRVLFSVLISLLVTYLLSPPTLQAGEGRSSLQQGHWIHSLQRSAGSKLQPSN